MVEQMAKDFAEKHIRPHVMEWDEAQHFPAELFKKLGELGMMSVFVPEEYGGSGFGYFEYVTVIQEIAKVCGSIGLSVAAHNSLCTGHILNFGNQEQKMKWAGGLGHDGVQRRPQRQTGVEQALRLGPMTVEQVVAGDHGDANRSDNGHRQVHEGRKRNHRYADGPDDLKDHA